MMQKQDGDDPYFYDSYAIIAVALGQPSYEQYVEGVRIFTSIFHLYEAYFVLLQKGLPVVAERIFERLLPFCVSIEPQLVKQAANFRLQHHKLNISYADAIGYILAQSLNVPFLTGDDAFLKFSGVEFKK